MITSFFSSPIIEFFCQEELFGAIPEPTSAFSNIPSWFKKIPTSVSSRDGFGAKAMSAKKCMPLLDAMSLGFIIPSYRDVNFRVNADGSLIDTGPTDSPANRFGPIIQFHDKEQLGGKTSPSFPGDAIKWINPWVIKTAPGYSVLITPCLNHLEDRFTILSGVVDTDNYPKEINFPAILNVKAGDYYIPAGTPLATVIPFKRNSIPRVSPPRVMSKKELAHIHKLKAMQDTRRGVYSNELREDRK